MSDDNTQGATQQPGQPAPQTAAPQTVAPSAASPAQPDALAEAKREHAAALRQLDEQRAATAAAIRQRDEFKTQVDQLAPRAKQADDLQLKVETLTNEKRAADIYDALRVKLPGIEGLALRGVVAQLHAQGKANQFAEDATKEADKFIDLIRTEAPSMLKQVVSSGTPGARQITNTNTWGGPAAGKL